MCGGRGGGGEGGALHDPAPRLVQVEYDEKRETLRSKNESEKKVSDFVFRLKMKEMKNKRAFVGSLMFSFNSFVSEQR